MEMQPTLARLCDDYAGLAASFEEVGTSGIEANERCKMFVVDMVFYRMRDIMRAVTEDGLVDGCLQECANHIAELHCQAKKSFIACAFSSLLVDIRNAQILLECSIAPPKQLPHKPSDISDAIAALRALDSKSELALAFEHTMSGKVALNRCVQLHAQADQDTFAQGPFDTAAQKLLASAEDVGNEHTGILQRELIASLDVFSASKLESNIEVVQSLLERSFTISKGMFERSLREASTHIERLGGQGVASTPIQSAPEGQRQYPSQDQDSNNAKSIAPKSEAMESRDVGIDDLNIQGGIGSEVVGGKVDECNAPDCCWPNPSASTDYALS